jgi:hypothetical protein
MEILIALVVFGLLGAFTLYGYSRSEATARARGDFDRGDRFAMVPDRETRADSTTSPTGSQG